jgi:general nucleoside transport system permease protein
VISWWKGQRERWAERLRRIRGGSASDRAAPRFPDPGFDPIDPGRGLNAGFRATARNALIVSAGPVVLSVGLGLVLAAVAVRALGASPGEFYGRLFAGTLGSAYGFSQVLFKATPLLFTGLAVAVAFRARLFNIGAEGQMVAGGFAMAWVGFAGPALPAPLGLLLALAAGAAAGAAWGAIPGLIRARTGGSEVIVTIMLNFIAVALVNWLLVTRFALPESVRTAEVHASAWLPRFSDHWIALRGSPLNGALVLGILLAAVLHVVLGRTVFGFSLRVLGEGSTQARYAGLPVGRLIVQTMLLSGALAGLAGSSFILGYKRYYEGDFSAGAGFTGIAVALLARNRPLLLIPSAIFFGMLSYGGLVVNSIVPRELLEVLQAVILILFIVFDRLLQRLPLRPHWGQATPSAPAVPAAGETP